MNDFSKYTTVSFDLFDTLIKRDVRKPIDVFKIVYSRLNDKYKCNFPYDRRMAELDLYKKKKYEEISIDEIYDNFPPSYSKKAKDEFKKMELEIEYEICTFNEKIRTLYNEACKNKKVIIITDIYLPKEHIEKVLKKCGVNYDKLYLSSDIRLKKKTGNLFKYVLDNLKISPKEMIHIGDNKISDYKIPKTLGISTYKIRPVENNSTYNSITTNNTSFEYSILSSFINNRVPLITDRLEKIGYETLGPLLFGFSKWLYNNFEKEKYDKILFLSRDGQIIKKAFDIYDIQHKYNSHYFYASRRALIVPNLKDCSNVKEMFDLFTFPKYITMNAIIKKFGLPLDYLEVKKTLSKYKIDANKSFYFEKYDDLNDTYKDALNDLYISIVNNSKEEHDNEYKYINNKLSKEDKHIAIIDIGWYGNMQINLEKTLKQIGDFIVSGYYIGLVPKYSNKKALKMTGYLFNTNDNSFENYIREKNFNSLFELLFSADHGTVIKYKNDNNVVLSDFEYSSEQLKKIQKLQNGALKFVKDISNNHVLRNIDYSKDDISYNIYNLGNNPLYIDAKTIGDFLFMDNSICKLSNYEGNYIFKPQKMLSDFKTSQWKVAFLRLLFKINLPYETICRILRGKKIR